MEAGTAPSNGAIWDKLKKKQKSTIFNAPIYTFFDANKVKI
jgi:hypothetical protein